MNSYNVYNSKQNWWLYSYNKNITWKSNRKNPPKSKEKKNAVLNIMQSYIPEYENVSLKKKKTREIIDIIVVYRITSH